MSQESTVATARVNGGRATTAPPDSRRWLALAVIALAQLMVVLDATVVNIALPKAQQALDISDANRQWIVTAYTITFGGLLLLGGRVADFFGRKRAFLIGLIGFAAASGLGGAAVNGGTLFGARALQGAFGALLAPAALSLITVTFQEPRERAKAFGVYGAVSGGGAAIGLISGGLLTEYANWRWCLLVNIPVALIAFAAALPLVHESRAHGNTRYDIPGAVLATGGLSALVYGFTKAATEHDHWTAPATLLWLGLAAVLLVGFVWWENVTKNPLLPMRVVLDRNRGTTFAISVLVGAGLLGMFLFMTYYLQLTMHYSPIKTGVAYLPFSAGIVVGSGIASQILPKVGPRVLLTVGGLMATGALIYLTRLNLHSSYASDILPAFITMSVGMGLIFVPMSATALSGVGQHDAGVASAMVNTTQQVGGSLGTALLNTIFTTVSASYLTAHLAEGPLAKANAAIHGYNVAFTASAVLLGVGALLAFLFVRKPEEIKPDAVEGEVSDTAAATPVPAAVH
jgi:EmrB/QacA subfamily drug resistance transporter